MRKIQIRTLKSHYQSRWAVLRHNQKHHDKILLLTDQFVIKNLVAGSTLAYHCLGEMYQGIVPNISLTPADKNLYNNIVLVNNTEFKYKTPEQLSGYIEQLADPLLLPNGRVILSFEHRFLVYNRVEISVDAMLSAWTKSFKKFKLKQMLNLLGRTQPGYGDYFFCLERNE